MTKIFNYELACSTGGSRIHVDVLAYEQIEVFWLIVTRYRLYHDNKTGEVLNVHWSLRKKMMNILLNHWRMFLLYDTI